MAFPNQPLSSIEALSQVAHDMYVSETSISPGNDQSYGYGPEQQGSSNELYVPQSAVRLSSSESASLPGQGQSSNTQSSQFQFQRLDNKNAVKLEGFSEWSDRALYANSEAGAMNLSTSMPLSSRRPSHNADFNDTPNTNHDPSMSVSEYQHVDSAPATNKSNDVPVMSEDIPQPSWSELKTKAGKERKRLPLACIACRRKKIRCSGEKPACKHCLRSRIPCVYKVTTRKATPRTDYMAMLDKRLKRMEERIIKAVPRSENNEDESLERAALKPQVTKDNGARSSLGKKRSAKEAFSDDIEGWANQGVTSSDIAPDPALLRQDGLDKSLMTAGAEFLPSFEIQEYLVEVFFDYVYGQAYHLLHKPTLVRKLKTRTAPPVLILAVCAVASRFAEHPDIQDEPPFLRGECWAKEARNIAVRRYDEPNITILTVFLILGLHEFGACQGGRSWMFGGMAMRMAVALQLHKELDNDPLGQNGNGELSCTDREVRRRLMWACFLMDRFNSSGTGRPLFMAVDTLKIQLPIREDYFQMGIMGPTENLEGNAPNQTSPHGVSLANPSQNTGAAGFSIRVLSYWGNVIQYFNLGGKEKDPEPLWSPNSQFAFLKRGLESLKEGLPESLQYNERNLKAHASQRIANQLLFLHISYHQVLLFLHIFAIPAGPGVAPPQEIPKDFINKSGRTALEAASQISRLLLDSHGHRVVAPFVGYCAYLSSTVHIFGLFQRNSQLRITSKQNLEINIGYLMQHKRYWGVFTYMTSNLKEIYHQYDGTAQKDQQHIKPALLSPSGALQYGDWFDRYPYGLSSSADKIPPQQTRVERNAEILLHDDSDLQSIDKLFASVPTPITAEKRKNGRKPPMRRPATVSSATKSASHNETAKPGGVDKTNAPKSRRATTSATAVSASKENHAVEPQISSSTAQPAATTDTFSNGSGGNSQQPYQTPLNAPMIFPQPDGQQQPDSMIQDFPIAHPPLQLQPNELQQHQTMLENLIPTGAASSAVEVISPLPQQGVLPELDRQLVYGAYLGLEPKDTMPSLAENEGIMQQESQERQQITEHQHGSHDLVSADGVMSEGAPAVWAQAENAAAASGTLGAIGDFGLASLDPRNGSMGNTTWFIPFNTEPPWY